MASPTTGLPRFLVEHRPALEAALKAAIGFDPSPLATASRYVMGWEDADGRPAANEGKRIRPSLCLFAAEAFGGTTAGAMPGAVAVELVHNFSLVHDEVQDHDAERHGRPTVWARMGEGQAINAGDFLYTRALRALVNGEGPLDRRMAALGVLDTAIERMIAGQWQDIAFETRETVTVDEYLLMVAGKTGALLGAPLAMGALLAGAPAEQAALAGAWGEHVGLAFQAQDDYLGTWGDPDHTGKSNTNDIARRKKTLPIVHGLADPASAAVIRSAYARDTLGDADVATVREALEAAGADEACRDLARRHISEAERLLDGLPFDPTARACFTEIGTFLVDRDF